MITQDCQNKTSVVPELLIFTVCFAEMGMISYIADRLELELVTKIS